MTDFEINKSCAEAMGFRLEEKNGHWHAWLDEWRFHYLGTWQEGDSFSRYDPLHDDAQAMALVKRFRLHINSFHGAALLDSERWWEIEHNDGEQATITKNTDLNRAIATCVAKMQLAKRSDMNSVRSEPQE